ncbi:P-loop containing nucleoside triphosphate hydrolase protein [Phellopilus nigrolimitatus]|nr:P-loop containing nucleoside triphosphate hydrolase protein [Phellopilus nigrolimitatus]
MSLFDAWNASRPLLVNQPPDGKSQRLHLQPGSHRKWSFMNIWLAFRILQATFVDMLILLWGLNPVRTAVLICLTIIRGLLPAFRGYSQALILDEANLPSARLGSLVVREGFRMLVESLFDTVANHNENIVHSSMRFLMEHRQLEQRLRLDLPTLADPTIRDLLHESDLFVRSFTGFGFGFGLFSPLDLVRVLSSVAELASQIVVLYSASRLSSSSLFPNFSSDPSDPSEKSPVPHLPFLGALLLPSILSVLASCLPRLPFSSPANGENPALYTASEAREAERAERMRSMAHGEPFRAEVVLFGLAPWILGSWSSARRRILGLESQQNSLSSGLGFGTGLRWLLTQTNVSEMLVLVQNLPFLIYTSSTSLGSLALYRTSLQSLLFNARSLVTSFERAFQSVFFMGAFFAAMTIEPRLSPSPERRVKYESTGKGMKIEARNISYTYPGNTKPTLKNVSFTLEAGETLAIVGYNGSGKSTLANILLRIFDFDASASPDKPSQLLINGTDIRRISPTDYHRHVTALFQVFSKLNATVRENVGIGDVRSQFTDHAIREAAARAGAGRLLKSLPRGLDTNLECMGLGLGAFGDSSFGSGELDNGRQGLSGGEWQRVAISRAFMRARSADLLLLDEPTSHLDAHAQNNVLETVDKLCTDSKSGKRIKTVIIITHQLSIARRADKIAMFENGSISEFGTHEELMSHPDSHYASLYRATVC